MPGSPDLLKALVDWLCVSCLYLCPLDVSRAFRDQVCALRKHLYQCSNLQRSLEQWTVSLSLSITFKILAASSSLSWIDIGKFYIGKLTEQARIASYRKTRSMWWDHKVLIDTKPWRVSYMLRNIFPNLIMRLKPWSWCYCHCHTNVIFYHYSSWW